MYRNETQTRQQIIDKQLYLAGWDVNNPTQVTQELLIDLVQAGTPRTLTPKTQYDNSQFADYALLLNGKPIAVVEAKKTSRDAEDGKIQALQYAQSLQKINGGQIPFIFYTNGFDTFFWDYGYAPPRKIYGFPTKEDFEWMLHSRERRKPLSVELINTKIAGRDFQIAGIRKILEGIEAQDNNKQFLMVMATGTGKTRTAAGLFDVLIRAHWAKRILFLVDRIALRDQALGAFKEHLPESPTWPVKGDGNNFPHSRRIYVQTHQTMLGIIEGEKTQANYISPFFFDVVVVDECHRSVYVVYKAVLDYFHATKIGLTATPTDYLDRDTFSLFDCPMSLPTFAYNFEEAVNHKPPYLNNYSVLKVRSKFQIEGIRGRTLSEEDQDSLRNQGIDPENVDFEGKELESKVTNYGTNALIVREFMDECIKDHDGALPGKTIFFCVSQAHARTIQGIFDRLYPEHKGTLSQVIVSSDSRAQDILQEFKTENFPRVAISVDMLDTGVDIPEVVNLVFAKPLYSYVKFWQMIGRGTRVLDPNKLKPWCLEKNEFLIIDCWNNFEYFEVKPKGREPNTQIALATRLFRSRLRQLQAAKEYGTATDVSLVINDLKTDLKSLPPDNIIVREAAKLLENLALDDYWRNVDERKINFLDMHIAPIFRARSGYDSQTLQFELDVVELKTAILKQEVEKTKAIAEIIKTKVSELPLSVNLVAEQHDLIDELLINEEWENSDFSWLDNAVKNVGPLMRYRDTNPPPPVRINLPDITVEKIPFGSKNEKITLPAYREKLEAYIKELEAKNIVLQKLKNGIAVSSTEILEISNLLQSNHYQVSDEFLGKLYNQRSLNFLQLLHHVLGLKRIRSWEETVTTAFDNFISEHNTLTALQVQFIQTLRTFILQNKKISRADLVEAPFTHIHSQGVRGVFKPNEIEQIIEFSEKLVA